MCPISEFSYQGWLTSNNLADSEYLTEVLIARLIDDLGIGRYFEDDVCHLTAYPYSNNEDGWTNCKSLIYQMY